MTIYDFEKNIFDFLQSGFAPIRAVSIHFFRNINFFILELSFMRVI